MRPKYGRYVKRNPDQNTLLGWFQMIQAELGSGNGPSEATEISSGRTLFRILWRPSLPGLFSMKNDQRAAIAEPGTAAAAAAAAAETGHGQVFDLNNDTRS